MKDIKISGMRISFIIAVLIQAAFDAFILGGFINHTEQLNTINDILNSHLELITKLFNFLRV